MHFNFDDVRPEARFHKIQLPYSDLGETSRVAEIRSYIRDYSYDFSKPKP
jgi:hypothetical protein